MNRIDGLCQKIGRCEHHSFRKEMELTVLDDERTAGEPHAIRKAKALEKLLAVMPVHIQEGELIVGWRTLFGLPEYVNEEEMRNRNPHIETAGRLEIFDFVYNLCQDPRGYGTANGVVPGHHNVLAKGFKGIRLDAANRLDELLREGEKKEIESVHFLKEVGIVSDAIIMFAGRYAEEADRLASVEKDNRRKGELKTIAGVCRNVPGNPPRTFHEALQSVFFTHLVTWAEGGFLVPLGRFDQYIYPFYESDIRKGIIIREQALELLQCFFIKLNADPDKTHGKPSYMGDTGHTIVIGGQTPDGKDAVNDISFLCLDAVENIRMVDPKLRARIHSRTSDSFLHRVCELIKLGMGEPSIENDEIIVPALLKLGYRKEDALDYAIAGCWEILIPGRSSEVQGGAIKLPLCLEWALNDGCCFLSGKQLGIHNGDISSLTTFDELFDAFRKQVAYYITRVVQSHKNGKWSPMPFISSTLDDCIRQAKDISQGGARYRDIGLQAMALANITDSLFAIKTLVYDNKELTLSQLREILLNNFEGKETLRQRIINKIPKYGNEIDEVEQLAEKIALCFTEEVSRHKSPLGGHFRPRFSSGGSHAFAEKYGASADGRKAGEMFAVSLAPMMGREEKGPTAVINSVSRLPLTEANGGGILDLMFHPSALSGEEGTEKFMALVKTFIQKGGMQMQINVVSNKTLLDARENPEKYPDLTVRVYGFTAHFVTLLPKLQDHLIARSQYEYNA